MQICLAESRRLVRADRNCKIMLIPEPPRERRKRLLDSDGFSRNRDLPFARQERAERFRQIEWYRGEILRLLQAALLRGVRDDFFYSVPLLLDSSPLKIRQNGAR